MSTRNIIDYALEDNAWEMRNALYAELHDRVQNHIEAHKQQVAASMFATEAKMEHDDEKEDKTLVKKMVKKDCLASESWDDDEDDDVARADRELARMKVKPIKADPKTNPDKEFSKLAKKTPKEVEEEFENYLHQNFTLEELIDFMVSEDVHELDEMSKKTLGRYIKKASSYKH